MTPNPEPRLRAFLASRRGFALALAVLFAALAFALFCGLGAGTVGRTSEQRCVEVVRKMVESGEYLVPRFAGRVRLQKPPLFYWAGAAVARLSGDTGPWSVRVVSALAALGVAALVAAWGLALGGRGEGLLAAGLLAAMVQVTASGRRGDAEMLLALLSTGALVCFDRIHAGRWRAGLPVFALLAGLAFLAKATAVLIGIGLPIFVYLALRRELRALRDPGVLWSLAGAAALGVSWYLAIVVLVPGAFEALRDALLLPLGTGEAHSGSAHFHPIYWYLWVLPARALPASLLLPLVVWRLAATRVYRGDPRRRLAALAFLVPLVAFSLLPQKQKHYTLAMLPGLALCSADAARAAARELGALFSAGLRLLATPLALVGAAATCLVGLFFLWAVAVAPAAAAAIAVLPLAAFALACAAALLSRPASFASAFVVGFLALFGVVRGEVEPRVAALPSEFGSLPMDDRERLAALTRDHPWFVRLLLYEHASIAGEGD